MSRLDNDKKIRLNLTMNTQVKLKLEELQKKTQADSMSEVIRRALALYDLIWTEKNNECATIIRCKDGKEREVELL